MDSTASDPGTGPPERVVTPNMLVAYNMSRWRQASGMTQPALGEALGGWTKGAVSAAERSWDGKRVRQFDADLLCDLAAIFCVPVGALLLPPPDDEEAVRYVISGEDGPVPMEQLFALLWPDPQGHPATAAMGAYQQAVISAMAKYASGEAAEALAENMADMAAEEEIEGALRSARANRDALTAMHSVIDRLADENEMLQGALQRALAGKKAGQ